MDDVRLAASAVNVPRAYAFFDVDDTLIAVKSLLSFQEYWYRWANDPVGLSAYRHEINSLLAQDAPWEYVNRRYYAYFAGRAVAEVERCGRDWFAQMERDTPQLFHPATVRRLQQHQQRGEEPVLVSGSFPAVIAPVAERLQVQHVLAIRQQVESGIFTGEILPPQTIGQGKADAIAEFLQGKPVRLADCTAYGDDISDAPMLACVGHPVAIRGGRRLEQYATARGWALLSPHEVELS